MLTKDYISLMEKTLKRELAVQPRTGHQDRDPTAALSQSTQGQGNGAPSGPSPSKNDQR
jgi:hypothetical protein